MNEIRFREFRRLNYRDPRSVLLKLRKVETAMVGADISARVRHLRTNDLRPIRELRSACLFCYGMTHITGQRFAVAHSENADYDAVATWIKDNTQSFAPIQIKETPPAELNATATVQEVVTDLAKYVNSEDLTVAVHLNRVTQFAPSKLVVSPLKVAALWVFGAISPDQSRWAIWGNFLDEELQADEFSYPTE